MKKTIIRHLISFAITFVAIFLITIAPALSVGDWTGAFWIAAIAGSARSAFKLAYEIALIPLALLLKDYAKKLRK